MGLVGFICGMHGRFFPYRCHPKERSDEGSREHKVDVTEILRFALNDKI